MVTIATPGQSARKILSIFVATGCGPGDTIEMKYFIEAWAARKLNDDYFMPGMEFAVRQGWVEVVEDRDYFRLTEKGFVET